MNAARIAAVTVLLLAAVNAVMPTAQQTAFDVASIVPSADDQRTAFRYTPSGLVYTSATLSDCIQAAYQVSRFQISGPDWLTRTRFNITARAAGAAPKDQLMVMLQSLLADRFALRLHREPREMRAFALVVAKGGPKLTRSGGDQNGSPDLAGTPDGVALNNHTMDDVAHYVSRLGPIGMPTVNTTGIDGRFDIQLNLVPLAAGKKGDARATEEAKRALIEDASTVFNEALAPYGLKLESRRLPLDVLIVDQAEKKPTEN